MTFISEVNIIQMWQYLAITALPQKKKTTQKQKQGKSVSPLPGEE